MRQNILAHLPKDEHGRYPSIDIFRGIAIFTMLAANSAAGSLAAPHHFYFRIYGSFAAPFFVFLAGFMVAAGSHKHSAAYFLRRGLEIILVGALIDVVIWQVFPFTTFDVLYLTGFGICVAGFFMKLKPVAKVIITLLCLAAGPVLLHLFSYDAGVPEFDLNKYSPGEIFQNLSVRWWPKSWLFDGWFPVFPWIGILFAGTLAYTHGALIVKKVKLFLPLGVLLFIGGITRLYFHRPIDEREGYSELFYPAGAAYLTAAFGAIITITSLLPFLKPVFGLQFLRYLGSCSLFIYILHSALIYYVLDKFFGTYELKYYLLLYAGFAATMIFCAWILFELKKKAGWKKIPKFLHFIFGG